MKGKLSVKIRDNACYLEADELLEHYHLDNFKWVIWETSQKSFLYNTHTGELFESRKRQLVTPVKFSQAFFDFYPEWSNSNRLSANRFGISNSN